MTARARRTTATTTLVATTHPSTIAMLVTKARKAMGVGMTRLLKGRTVAIRAWTGPKTKRTRSDDDDDVGCYVCRQESHNKMWSAFVARSANSKMLMHNVPYNNLCIKLRPIRRYLANHLQNGWRFGGCLVLWRMRLTRASLGVAVLSLFHFLFKGLLLCCKQQFFLFDQIILDR